MKLANRPTMRNTIILILFVAISSVAFSQNTMYNGYWRGEIKSQDTSFVVSFSIMTKPNQRNPTIIGGMITKPEFCAIEETPFNDSILHFKPEYTRYKLKPVTSDIKFKGVLTADKNKMSGDFTYCGKVYKLDLRRGEEVVFRPQEPKKPFPTSPKNKIRK